MDRKNFLGRALGGLVNLGRKILGMPEPFKPTTHTFEVPPGEPQERFIITKKLSRKDRNLPLDVFKVKQKLGASFFTRSLTARTRRARVATLKKDELEIARSMGWVL